jgi:hypothetical protein
MSRIVIVMLICHRHKPVDPIDVNIFIVYATYNQIHCVRFH